MRSKFNNQTARFAAIACLTALAACSAMDYTTPISTFAEATVDAETALRGLNKKATAEYTEFLAHQVVSERSFTPEAAGEDCTPGSDRCRIVFIDPSGKKKPVFYPPEPLLENMAVVMGEIRIYAQRLAALVKDDSAAKAQVDVNAALGSIQKLANTVSAMGGEKTKSMTSFATPAANAVNWVVGRYAESVKLDGLKTATKAADPVIKDAAALFGEAADLATGGERDKQAKDVRTKLDSFSSKRTQVEFEVVVSAARKYDDFLRAQPEMAFKKMSEAHTALASALQNPKLSLPDAIAKIESFADQAKQLSQIIKDLAAIGDAN